MDPFTHALIGVAASKIAGLDIHLAEPATLAVIAGSVLPDIDIILQRKGHFAYLKNHRGVTHSIPSILVSGILIAGIIMMFFPKASMGLLFLLATAGGVSHVVADIFNSYGTKLLWPFNQKKVSLRFLASVDPILSVLLLVYVLAQNIILQDTLIGSLLLYLLLRWISMKMARWRLEKRFSGSFDKIHILPAAPGLYRWHFIAESSKYHVVGDVKMVRGRIKIRHRLKKAQCEAKHEMVASPVGQFFKEFTPFCHVSCEEEKGITRYTFVDMRYYIKDKFLYRGILEIDEKKSIIKESFDVY